MTATKASKANTHLFNGRVREIARLRENIYVWNRNVVNAERQIQKLELLNKPFAESIEATRKMNRAKRQDLIKRKEKFFLDNAKVGDAVLMHADKNSMGKREIIRRIYTYGDRTEFSTMSGRYLRAYRVSVLYEGSKSTSIGRYTATGEKF